MQISMTINLGIANINRNVLIKGRGLFLNIERYKFGLANWHFAAWLAGHHPESGRLSFHCIVACRLDETVKQGMRAHWP